MLVTPSDIVTFKSPVQLLNASSPTVFTFPGIVTSVSFLHKLNAPSPMLVMFSGIVRLSRELHERKALISIVLIPFGICTLVSELQLLNAYSPKYVTVSGIFTFTIASQSENAQSPMLVTLSGMVTSVSVVQLANAILPIPVTFFPSISDGMTNVLALPLYFVISAVSPETLYSKSPYTSATALTATLSLMTGSASPNGVAKTPTAIAAATNPLANFLYFISKPSLNCKNNEKLPHPCTTLSLYNRI